ncbi:TPA: hypothetical protein G9F10_004028 [Salmonella enterica]|nr:hypothetical protein [Salmonella enterica]
MSKNGCQWIEAPNAFSSFPRGGGSDESHEKTASCPADFVMTGTRMYGVAPDVDDEHVDAYCCPFGG